MNRDTIQETIKLPAVNFRATTPQEVNSSVVTLSLSEEVTQKEQFLAGQAAYKQQDLPLYRISDDVLPLDPSDTDNITLETQRQRYVVASEKIAFTLGHIYQALESADIRQVVLDLNHQPEILDCLPVTTYIAQNIAIHYHQHPEKLITDHETLSQVTAWETPANSSALQPAIDCAEKSLGAQIDTKINPYQLRDLLASIPLPQETGQDTFRQILYNIPVTADEQGQVTNPNPQELMTQALAATQSAGVDPKTVHRLQNILSGHQLSLQLSASIIPETFTSLNTPDSPPVPVNLVAKTLLRDGITRRGAIYFRKVLLDDAHPAHYLAQQVERKVKEYKRLPPQGSRQGQEIHATGQLNKPDISQEEAVEALALLLYLKTRRK